VRLALQQSDYFWADLQKQVDWYRDKAWPEVAERDVAAVEATLHELAETPGLGRPRFHDWPELAGLHSWRVRKPYHRHLIFYRETGSSTVRWWSSRTHRLSAPTPARNRQIEFKS
jgi:plasmid stabilization system protein ParE